MGFINNPGIQRVHRYLSPNGEALADMIYEEGYDPQKGAIILDPLSSFHQRLIESGTKGLELLTTVFRQGQCVYKNESLELIRNRVKEQLALFHKGIKRFENPHSFPVGLEKGLYRKKRQLRLHV